MLKAEVVAAALAGQTEQERNEGREVRNEK